MGIIARIAAVLVLLLGGRVMATTWYVDLGAGSDSNNGTAFLTPRLTLPLNAAVTSGDTILVWGQSTGGAPSRTYINKSNLLISQLYGQAQAVMHGGIQTGTGWSSAGGSKYTKTLATGLTISRFGFKIDASVAATNHHFGVMRSAAGANNSGEYDYNSGTGVTTINVPQAPSAAADVVYATVDAVTGAIVFQGGSNNRVEGITFLFYPSLEGQQSGWGVRVEGSSNCTVFACAFDIMGYHSAGCATISGSGDSSGMVIDSCWFGSNGYSSTQVVFHQNAAQGALSQCRVRNSIFRPTRYIGVDGVTATAGQTAMAQVPVYAHTDAGTTTIVDVAVENCAFFERLTTGTESPQAWIDGGLTNVADPASGLVWDNYAIRADRCTFSNLSDFWSLENIAFRRCVVLIPNAVSATDITRIVCLASLRTGGYGLMESCAFIIDGTSAGNYVRFFGLNQATQKLFLINCSVYDSSAQATQGRVMVEWNNITTAELHARGCVFSWRTTGADNYLNADDSTVTAGKHDFLDCAYHGLPSADHWSQNIAFNSQANWLALVDTSQRVLATTPYPNAPTDLTPTVASSIWGIRRATATVPSFGLDGPYVRVYGAYQLPGFRPASRRRR